MHAIAAGYTEQDILYMERQKNTPFNSLVWGLLGLTPTSTSYTTVLPSIHLCLALKYSF